MMDTVYRIRFDEHDFPGMDANFARNEITLFSFHLDNPYAYMSSTWEHGRVHYTVAVFFDERAQAEKFLKDFLGEQLEDILLKIEEI